MGRCCRYGRRPLRELLRLYPCHSGPRCCCLHPFGETTLMQFKAVISSDADCGCGIILSIIGIFSVRTKEDAKMKDLLNSLAFGTNLSSVLIVVATFLVLWLLVLGQLDVDSLLGGCRPDSRYRYRTFYGILYFSVLSPYSEG